MLPDAGQPSVSRTSITHSHGGAFCRSYSIGVGGSERGSEEKDREYWPLWGEGALGYSGVLSSSLTRFCHRANFERTQVNLEGKSAMTDQWFQTTRAPAIKRALAVLVETTNRTGARCGNEEVGMSIIYGGWDRKSGRG